MVAKRPEKERTRCQPADHNYVELTKLIAWKGGHHVLIYCTKCGQTEFVGTVDGETGEQQ